MTLVKGPNGLIVDIAPSIASGLIGGGHVVAVNDDQVEDSETISDDADQDNDEHGADQDEQTDDQVDDSDDDSDESSIGDPARPGGNASKQAWYDYALAQGFAEKQLDGLKQTEIRNLLED